MRDEPLEREVRALVEERAREREPARRRADVRGGDGLRRAERALDREVPAQREREFQRRVEGVERDSDTRARVRRTRKPISNRRERDVEDSAAAERRQRVGEGVSRQIGSRVVEESEAAAQN